MEIQPKQPATNGPDEWFTGDVSIERIVQPDDSRRLSILAVHFQPGARTAWHSHSNGQILYVTEGEGLVQSRGETIAAMNAGDTIITPADEWHWHGASPHHHMTHLSITEGDAQWGDHVPDADYHGGDH